MLRLLFSSLFFVSLVPNSIANPKALTHPRVGIWFKQVTQITTPMPPKVTSSPKKFSLLNPFGYIGRGFYEIGIRNKKIANFHVEQRSHQKNDTTIIDSSDGRNSIRKLEQVAPARLKKIALLLIEISKREAIRNEAARLTERLDADDILIKVAYESRPHEQFNEISERASLNYAIGFSITPVDKKGKPVKYKKKIKPEFLYVSAKRIPGFDIFSCSNLDEEHITYVLEQVGIRLRGSELERVIPDLSREKLNDSSKSKGEFNGLS